MGFLRICVVSAALTLAAAVSVLPVQVASAITPDSNVLVPAPGVTVSGTQVVLDATANGGTTQLNFELSGGSLSDSVIATVNTESLWGWATTWNSTTVPNGVYDLLAVPVPPVQVEQSGEISITVNNPAPATAVVLPANNATVSGTTTYFDATASSGVTNVTYELSGGPSDLNDVQVATGTGTLFGWLAVWNTTTVPNGNYTLQSVASYSSGVTGTSAPIGFAVDNAPPTTNVLIPADGSTLDDAKGYVLDASASPGVTKVSIEVTIAGEVETAPTTPTIYGWIAVLPPVQPCPQCSPVPVLSTIQSVASYPGGVSGTSPNVNITIIYYLEIVEP